MWQWKVARLSSFHTASIFHGTNANAPRSLNIEEGERETEGRQRGATEADSTVATETASFMSFWCDLWTPTVCGCSCECVQMCVLWCCERKFRGHIEKKANGLSNKRNTRSPFSAFACSKKGNDLAPTSLRQTYWYKKATFRRLCTQQLYRTIV